MKWFNRENPLKAVVEAQKASIEQLIADRDYFRDRAEKATDALLALQQKPALTKPDEKATEAFLSNHLNMFRDEEGGQEVA